VDVGYGDLFVKPIELVEEKIQTDGRNYFILRKDIEADNYILLMSSDTVNFEIRYKINLKNCEINDFREINQEKQIHPDSYFVRNLVCTKPTATGRVTLFNDKLITKEGSERKEITIENKAHLKSILFNYFGIELRNEISYPLSTR
jgi:N-hydroxyarylamine O-acetyltransferase